MSTAEEFERYGPRAVEEKHPQVSIRYARFGTVSHITWDDTTSDPEDGICGRTGLAYGTGTWDERIKARRMPLCIRCARSKLNVDAVTTTPDTGAAAPILALTTFLATVVLAAAWQLAPLLSMAEALR